MADASNAVRISGKEAFLRQLVADGVRYVFGNPGTTEQAFMDLLQDFPQLEFILCLHEGVAVSMADTFARATRRPAFVQLHIAPGLGNAAGMLFNAMSAHTPMLVYVGQGASNAMFQEPHLSGDLVGIAKPISKWAYEVNHASDLPQAVRRAFKVADEAPQGPVVLSIPLDVMDETTDVSIEPTSYTKWQVHPHPDAIDEAAKILRSSERPLLLIGDGVALSDGQEEVGRIAELLGAPIYLGYSTEINVAPDHPLFCGMLPFTSATAAASTRKLLAQHDVLLAVGTPLFRFIFPSPGNIVPNGMKIVHIDIDGWEIGKNIGGVLGIKGDCRAALTALIERLRPNPPSGAAARVDAISIAQRERRQKTLTDDRRTWDKSPISVSRLMSELADVLPPDAAIFDEAMTASPVLARYVVPRPGRYFRARGGGIGPGLPGTVALKLAMPDRPVVGVCSDGAAMYNISALWTAAHHRIPVTWVICNNASYRILKQNVMDYLGPAQVDRKFVAMDLTDPPLRFDRIAESFGVHGRRVERPEHIRSALEEALRLDAPALVDVAIDGAVR